MADALGILAGQGALPAKIVGHCKSQNRPCFILGFEGNFAADAFAHTPHAIIRFSAIGSGLQHLRHAGVRQLVMAGNMKRPPMNQLKPEDPSGVKLLKKLGKAIFGGDDALLKALVQFLEEEGFEVVGVDQILGGLVASPGTIGKYKPNATQLNEIAKGFEHLQTIGACDIGQALVIENGYVLGVEAAEGTDALIERCAGLMKEEHQAILIKGKKPGQETRADMPTIGAKTFELLARYSYAGAAVEADATLIVDMEQVRAAADANHLFLYAHSVRNA